jgi:amino acid transporter
VTSPSAATPHLVRAIGRWDFTAAVINAVVGAAIFGMPATQAALTGSWSPATYLVAALGILTIMLCFAEVASRFDAAGGPYLYTRTAFGPWMGFQAGWLTFWVRVTSVAANLNVLASYLAPVLPWAGRPTGRAAVMVIVLGVITATNIRGVRQATWTVDVLTAAKLLPFVVLILLGLPRVSSGVLATQSVAHGDWVRAILLLVFAYGGFEAPLIAAGEVLNPRRDTAFALIVAIAVIASLYTLVQLVVIGLVPHVAQTQAPVASAFGALFGPVGTIVAILAAVTSICGWATGSVLQTPRLLFSMAEARELPALLGRVHPRFRTPHASILTYSLLALAFGLPGSFEWNATLSAIVRLVTYGLTCAALPVLRRHSPAEPGFLLRPAGLVVPLAVLFCLGLLASQAFGQVWILLVLMTVGALLWWITRRG